MVESEVAVMVLVKTGGPGDDPKGCWCVEGLENKGENDRRGSRSSCRVPV